ncbi:glutaredoxin family protein [Brevibacterium sp. 91QC2O2]|uniref:glutaredoxin family protein n=1 Tax=Brevibacterium TaxID=1696 RepID=UPI00211D1380|nr:MULTISPECIES: glutaredoxin family protein [unclassified Brevibacterium]MCQ9368231.1 glutaredoxin family protein [Brevibacterium sp. 91QC2O2]MCQ9385569.1 glutaredoxin family protein [Brevibacterium sp. 68QC2CO]
MSVALTFLTRADCHLCDAARRVVLAGIACRDVDLTEVDIDSDDDLRAKYDWDVPVVLINGRQHSFHRVDPDRLARALDRAESA